MAFLLLVVRQGGIVMRHHLDHILRVFQHIFRQVEAVGLDQHDRVLVRYLERGNHEPRAPVQLRHIIY